MLDSQTASTCLIDTLFYVLLTNVILYSQMLSLLRKSKNDNPKACRLEISGPGLRLVSVYMYGTNSDRYECNSSRSSGRSESIFRPVSCKHKKRNVSRQIRTHACLNSSRSHVNTPSFTRLLFCPPAHLPARSCALLFAFLPAVFLPARLPTFLLTLD